MILEDSVKFYALDEDTLTILTKLKNRLYTEQRIFGDEMRDWGNTLDALLRGIKDMEIPEEWYTKPR